MTEQTLEDRLRDYFKYGFPVSQAAWDDFRMDTLEPENAAPSALPDAHAVRRLSDRLNERHHHSARVLPTVQPGQLITMGLIFDVLRYMAGYYCFKSYPGVVSQGVDWVRGQRGHAVAEQPPPAFVDLFPPLDVRLERETREDFLNAVDTDVPRREEVTIEMLLLGLARDNRAMRPFRDLFDDEELAKRAPYIPLAEEIEVFFDQQAPFEELNLSLLKCLRAPLEASPDSLEGQLDYIRKNWARFLPKSLSRRMDLVGDILREERQLRGLGPGPNVALEFDKGLYGDEYDEPARFSRDADWMSNVVLLAKSTLVWLDQLSRQYKREIRRLDQIPDEELDRLARWGFTGLWLIGVWERSSASARIKQIMGNPEAAASAYSLYDYDIAEELGGQAAYESLRERAWQRGIRLASDMVPNHMGLYSKWVVEHPDWFVQLDYPPFPCYQYNGEDLSHDNRVVLQIEDGYWEHRDAAVVFRRHDKQTGEDRFIYHGNDGTSMPWNDTAQLNFLLPEVREAVIQTILKVARMFPIIRFDAAMTLAKKHYQRLWFPPPGHGGAIPSRAEHGMTREEFDKVFPEEFWRMVVDRVSQEAPDTLLLAEAFWLMEGYFVRTLGMHRVYNSAFMNMLKMEENQKYRTTIKNVLEFSPQVLKRFVNFMNNPDERTAVDQFGRDDKYFGVAVMLVTMPGLPMVGHGQTEGFTEKYGMEYRKAYWDEQPDEHMIRRHEQEVFPLMKRRRLFSGAEHFALYDFIAVEGWVDENVFAYSNCAGEERAVILYNNAFSTTRGHIHTSCRINMGEADTPTFVTRSVTEALGLSADPNVYYIIRDYRDRQEILRNAKELAEKGLYAELRGYEYHAFLDWREVVDSDGSWHELARKLEGRGVPSVEDAWREQRLEPILYPLREALHTSLFRAIAPHASLEQREERARILPFEEAVFRFLTEAKRYIGGDAEVKSVLHEILHVIEVVHDFESCLDDLELEPDVAAKLLKQVGYERDTSLPRVLHAWGLTRHLGAMRAGATDESQEEAACALMQDWFLERVYRQAFQEWDGDTADATSDALLVVLLTRYEGVFRFAAEALDEEEKQAGLAVSRIFEDHAAQQFLQMNRHEDRVYLRQELFERLVAYLLFADLVAMLCDSELTAMGARQMLWAADAIIVAAQKAGYQVDQMTAQMDE